MGHQSMLVLVCAGIIAGLNVCSVSTNDPVRVIDGDTLKIGKTTYRLNGIDAPEHGQKCNTPSGKKWPCGGRATDLLDQLVKDKPVRCAGTETDGYGRIIATCYVGTLELNREIVLRGLAWAFVKYSTIYAQEERIAKHEGLGIWQAPSQTAWEYRAERWSAAIQEVPEDCPIKGNISARGRLYHAPSSPWYDRTRINKRNGERWFCNEAEALTAGWRPAKPG